jgi:hypothetical protein
MISDIFRSDEEDVKGDRVNDIGKVLEKRWRLLKVFNRII